MVENLMESQVAVPSQGIMRYSRYVFRQNENENEKYKDKAQNEHEKLFLPTL